MTKCIYCLREKDDSEFTTEHIFPEALGGNLCGAELETDRVCGRCNNLSGNFIDGMFIRSWLCQANRFQSALKYLDWENGSPIPLMYYGLLDEFSSETEVCEYWGGPCGEHIYYFHGRDDLYFATYVKGDPIKRRKDRGYAIIFGTTTDPHWCRISLLSFKKQFSSAKRYSGNYAIQNEDGRKYFFHDPPSHVSELIERLRTTTNDTRKIRSVWATTLDHRFLAKMALGFGHKLLGDPFLGSPYALTLSQALWERDPDKRQSFKVRGNGFLEDKATLSPVIGWDGGHVLMFRTDDQYLSLSLILFGVLEGHVVISDDANLWRQRSTIAAGHGSVYIMVPQRDIGIGPIPLVDYIAHRSGIKVLDKLASLESMRIDPNDLPACHAEDDARTTT